MGLVFSTYTNLQFWRERKSCFFVSFSQQRARENREARKRMITDEYKFIIGIVGGYLDLEMATVEEFITDSEEVYLLGLFNAIASLFLLTNSVIFA